MDKFTKRRNDLIKLSPRSESLIRKSQIKLLGEHLLQMNSWAAVLGEGSRDCENMKLDIRKVLENGGFLIGAAKGLLIYMTELSTNL